MPRWLTLPVGVLGLILLAMDGWRHGDHRWRWMPLLAMGAAMLVIVCNFPFGDAEAAAVLTLLSPAAVTLAALLVALPLGSLARRYLWRADTVPLTPALTAGWCAGFVGWLGGAP